MGREARTRESSMNGATQVAMDWVDRAILISLLRQTTGTGIAHQKSLNRVLSALKGRHDWSYLDVPGANPFAVPDGQEPRAAVDLGPEVVDFLLREVFEKMALRGMVAEKLFGLLEDLEDVKAGRYELADEPRAVAAAGSA